MSALEAIGGDVEGALESVNFPAYVIDTAGVIRWLNPAALRLAGDVRGRQFTSAVAPEDRRYARDLFAQKVLGNVSVTDAEATLLDQHGDRIAVDISSVPLMRGGRVIGVFGQVLHEKPQPPLSHPALTPRQGEVLRLLEHGRSTHQIAQHLHLSPETVRNHVRGVFRALGVHSRLEAVAIARRDHLIAD